jgi:hypothetical protein
MCLGVTRLFSGFLQDRCKVLICDSDIGDTMWISRKVTALYPFKSQADGAPNFTEKFSQREGDHDNPAFQEALALAKLHSDASNSRQQEIMKLLQMGFLGRQKLVTLQTNLALHQERCSLAKKNKPSPIKGGGSSVKSKKLIADTKRQLFPGLTKRKNAALTKPSINSNLRNSQITRMNLKKDAAAARFDAAAAGAPVPIT